MERPSYLDVPTEKSIQDVSIDLTSPDAIDKLAAHDNPKVTTETGEDPIIAEDEREEAEHDAEISRERDGFNLGDMRFWRDKACRDFGDEIAVMRNVGIPEKDLVRIAENMAADILKEEARLNALRHEGSMRETKPSAAQDIVRAIMAQAEEMRPERPSLEQGTAVIDLIKKPEVDDDDASVA